MLTGIVVVTYNSEISRLNQILHSLASSDIEYVVSDNSTNLINKESIRQLCHDCGAHFVDMQGNVGIARAQNEGIKAAFAAGCTDILLLDDDSLPSPDMLAQLLKARASFVSKFGSMPVICANAVDENGNELSQYGAHVIDSTYSYRDIISSGTLVNKDIFDFVGLHEERLFIDCVDFEWGWRAADMGIRILLTKEAVLNHRLGNGRVKVINAGYGAPIRHYYQYRNIAYMLGRKYVPTQWRVSQFIKLIVKPFIIILFFDRKLTRLKYSLLGVRDYCKNKYGSIDSLT